MTPPLPRLLVLTDRGQCSRPLTDVVAAAVDGGARAVVLREKDLPDDERRRLADRLRGLLEPVDGVLVLAGLRLPGPAVHLAAADPVPAPRPALVGRSCHDAAEVRAATTDGCDWTTVSPLATTASKPGHGPVLGLPGLAALVDAGGPPAYALGGVTPADVPGCLAARAYGVAVMGPVMRAEQPARLVAEYAAALEGAA